MGRREIIQYLDYIQLLGTVRSVKPHTHTVVIWVEVGCFSNWKCVSWT